LSGSFKARALSAEASLLATLQGKGLVQRATESFTAVAGGALQSAKEMVGLAQPSTGEPTPPAGAKQKPQ
jgi:hypothetical protein